MTTFKKLKLGTKVILIIQSVAMLMGTSTHVSWAINNGFLSENYNAPLPNMIFWDSLTFLDPLAALLLFVRPKAGLILTLFIILADVAHNNLFYFEELYTTGLGLSDWITKYWMILGQLLFAVFALLTFRKCLKDINSITSVR
ncbi:MAG: hypothetical protein P8P74_10730 [Crocinitomicaceae bacterium]|nr:hypothetical protein [Crocinitomicaceae bacterium]